ncbi:DDE family transposase [Streptomyces sp. KS 21]|nr:DDE family transposase [Streptomyces sp. KS 21]
MVDKVAPLIDATLRAEVLLSCHGSFAVLGANLRFTATIAACSVAGAPSSADIRAKGAMSCLGVTQMRGQRSDAAVNAYSSSRRPEWSAAGRAGTAGVRRAIRALPEQVWHPALDADGTLRESAEIAELTGVVDLNGYPAGTRIIVRRERPHPGAQLSLFDSEEGLRHQVFLTDTPYSGGGSAQFLEVRHRGHATVEDHIRCGKTTGFGRFPSRLFSINAAWLELSLAAIDLLAWTRVLLLDGELAAAELRYRILHVAARLTRGGRRLYLRIAATWPWRHQLAAAFHRLAALPPPAN